MKRFMVYATVLAVSGSFVATQHCWARNRAGHSGHGLGLHHIGHGAGSHHRHHAYHAHAFFGIGGLYLPAPNYSDYCNTWSTIYDADKCRRYSGDASQREPSYGRDNPLHPQYQRSR